MTSWTAYSTSTARSSLTPTGLPRAQPYDHRIHQLSGTVPVAAHPYSYLQLQKDELERQCTTME